MIKILIVDDDYNGKIKDIVQLIKTRTELSNENIVVVSDTTSARKELHYNTFDLLILDMNVPTSMGEEPAPTGGIELLMKIQESQIQNFPHHIIGITGFEDIYSENKDILDRYLWALIHYDNTTNEWQEKILNKLTYLIKSKRTTYGSYYKKFDISIITALEDVELNAVLNLKCGWTRLIVPNDPTTNYYEGIIQTNTSKKFSLVVASAPKMGMTSSAILTTKMCMHFQPNYLFMVGIAAGIEGKNNYGDILVAENTWDWGSGKSTIIEGKHHFAPDQTQVTLDESILAKLKLIKSDQVKLDDIKNNYSGKKPGTSLKMSIGPIATGSSVVENDSIIHDIKGYQRKLIGVEMEIYGVMLATKYSTKPSPIGICIKSVCDYGNSHKNDDWQHYAAYTSVQMMCLLINELV